MVKRNTLRLFFFFSIVTETAFVSRVGTVRNRIHIPFGIFFFNFTETNFVSRVGSVWNGIHIPFLNFFFNFIETTFECRVGCVWNGIRIPFLVFFLILLKRIVDSVSEVYEMEYTFRFLFFFWILVKRILVSVLGFFWCFFREIRFSSYLFNVIKGWVFGALCVCVKWKKKEWLEGYKEERTQVARIKMRWFMVGPSPI